MAIVDGRINARGIVLEGEDAGFCACLRSRYHEIPFHDVLSAERSAPGCVQLRYLCRHKKPYRVRRVTARIDTHGVDVESGLLPPERGSSESSSDDSLCRYIERRAQGPQDLALRNHTVLVLINPHSGRNRAERLYGRLAAPVFAACGLKTSVRATRYAGEAREIIKGLDIAAYSAVVCVSGDGLVHEVLNGLCDREDGAQALASLPIAQLPGGSGNALSLSLNHGESQWGAVALGIAKGSEEHVDIMAVTQRGQLYYSFLSQSYGIIADADVGTDNLRWMGPFRFTYGVAVRCLARTRYPCRIEYKEGSLQPGSEPSLKPSSTIDDQIPADWTTEIHDRLSMFWVGNTKWMARDALIFPHAELQDGSMDMLLWDTSIGIPRAASALLQFENGGHVEKTPFYKKVSAYRLTPLATKPYFSVDGEWYDPEPFHVCVIPAAARFITPNFM